MNPFPKVLPFIHPFAFEEEANSGDSIQVTCHVAKGDLPLSIRWTHNGHPMNPAFGAMSNKIGDRISLLIISSVRAENSGNYSCVAGNKAGTVAYASELFVNGTDFTKPRLIELFCFNPQSSPSAHKPFCIRRGYIQWGLCPDHLSRHQRRQAGEHIVGI